MVFGVPYSFHCTKHLLDLGMRTRILDVIVAEGIYVFFHSEEILCGICKYNLECFLPAL